MITHPGPSGSPSFLGPPPGHMAGPPPSMGTVMPPPGLTPPMDPGSLTPDPSLMPPQMSMTPNGPMIPIYGPGGMPLTNAGPPMTGPSPSSLSPQQLDGRLSGPPPSMPPHPGIGHFQRRISLPPVDFKIYEMCRRLQQKPDSCDNIWWDQFVSDFFEDDATYTLNFFLEDGPKRYSFGRHLIPRFFRTMFDSGVAQLWYNLRNPKQEVLPSSSSGGVSVILECANALMCTYHAKPSAAHVATEGKLCVEFAASPGGDFGSMRVRHWNFTLGNSHEYLLRQDLQAITRNPNHPININASEQLNNLSKNITRSGLTNNILNYLRLCVILEPMQELMSRHKIFGASPRDCLKNTLFERFQRSMPPPHGPHAQPILPTGPTQMGAGGPHDATVPMNSVPEPTSRSNSKSRRKRKSSSVGGGGGGGNSGGGSSGSNSGNSTGASSGAQNSSGGPGGASLSGGGGGSSDASGGGNGGNSNGTSTSSNSSNGGGGGASSSKKKNNSSSNSSTNNLPNSVSPAFNPSNVDVLVVGEPSLMGGEFGDEDERKITRLENSSNNNTGTTPTGGSTSSNTNTSANPNPGTLTNSSSFNNNNNNTPSGGGVNSNPKNSNNNPSANNNIFTNANNILPPQPNNCTPPSPLGSIAPANASLNQSQPPNPNTPATLNGPRSSKVMNGPTSPGAVGASQLPSLGAANKMDLPNSSNSSPLLMNNSAANGNNFGSSLVNGGFMGPNSNPGTQMGDYMSPGSGGPKSEPGSIKTEPSLNNTPPPGGLDPRFMGLHGGPGGMNNSHPEDGLNSYNNNNLSASAASANNVNSAASMNAIKQESKGPGGNSIPNQGSTNQSSQQCVPTSQGPPPPGQSYPRPPSGGHLQGAPTNQPNLNSSSPGVPNQPQPPPPSSLSQSTNSLINSFMGSAAHSHAHSTSPSDFSVNDLNLKASMPLTALANSMEMKLGHQAVNSPLVPWNAAGPASLMPSLGGPGNPGVRAQDLIPSAASVAINAATLGSSFYSMHHK